MFRNEKSPGRESAGLGASARRGSAAARGLPADTGEPADREVSEARHRGGKLTTPLGTEQLPT